VFLQRPKLLILSSDQMDGSRHSPQNIPTKFSNRDDDTSNDCDEDVSNISKETLALEERRHHGDGGSGKKRADSQTRKTY
jgi:hypothetical protein